MGGRTKPAPLNRALACSIAWNVLSVFIPLAPCDSIFRFVFTQTRLPSTNNKRPNPNDLPYLVWEAVPFNPDDAAVIRLWLRCEAGAGILQKFAKGETVTARSCTDIEFLLALAAKEDRYLA
jgi:hypothetical protein